MAHSKLDLFRAFLEKKPVDLVSKRWRYIDGDLTWVGLPAARWSDGTVVYTHALFGQEVAGQDLGLLLSLCRERGVTVQQAGRFRASLWTIAAAGKVVLESPHSSTEKEDACKPNTKKR